MLEITVQRRKGDVYPVVAEHHRQGSLLPIRSEGSFSLLTEPSSPLPRTYGTDLGKALFRDDIRDALKAVGNDESGGARILLHVEAEELKTWRWEWLCAPFDGGTWDFLTLDQKRPFSLYLPSLTEGTYPPIGRRDLRALVVVANPSDPKNRYGFSPFNADQNIDCLKALFGRQNPIVEADILSRSEGAADLPTFDSLIKQLTKGTPSGPYTILHLVCHGRFNRESGETYLYLEQSELDPDSGKALAEPVKGSELIDQLRRIRLPYLVFLSVCESSAPEAEQRLGGLAQRLVRERGIPAVIGMTEPVTVVTAQPLAKAFYERLLARPKRGEVDRSLAEAYAGLARRPDVNVPALYSRLADQPLFSIALDRSLTNEEIRAGLEPVSGLLSERAPVLQPQFKDLTRSLKTTLQTDPASLSAAAKADRETALQRVNALCQEAIDVSFNALAQGEHPPAYDPRQPFRGLSPFRAEDREFFFGRETLVQELLAKLKSDSFLAVLGPSGSGKSSVVLAGVAPHLRQQEPGLQVIDDLTPGTTPLAQLKIRQDKLQPGPVLYIIDQFEELFTLCRNEAGRKAFIEELLGLAQTQRVILTMRADFLGECTSYPDLKERVAARLALIAPLTTAELRSVMEQQAAKVGLRFEADLANTILEEVAGEPGAMPLLQHALLELWKHRHGRWLKTKEYRAIGGVKKAIAQTADRIYNELPPESQPIMRDIFLRLTRVDESVVNSSERRDTRRRLPLDDLMPAKKDAELTKALVKELADAVLVVTSLNTVTVEAEVEVAHEAIIRHWARLRSWLDEDLKNLRLRESISNAAKEWDQRRDDESLLVHRGSKLKTIEVAIDNGLLNLNLHEVEYFNACLKLAAQDLQRQRKLRDQEKALEDLTLEITNFRELYTGGDAEIEPGHNNRPVEVSFQESDAGFQSSTNAISWAVSAVGADKSTSNGRGSVVAMLDTGVDVVHPTFRGVKLIQRDFTDTGNGDKNGHGTSVASIILGRDARIERYGIAVGVTELLVAKILDDRGQGSLAPFVDALNWVLNYEDGRVDVVCLSVGFDFLGLMRSSEDNRTRISEGINAFLSNLRSTEKLTVPAAAKGKGVLIFAPVGNEGGDDGRRLMSASLPSLARGVISVGAVEQTGAGYRVTAFSSGRPTLSAPGGNISVARLNDQGYGITKLSGTSLACACAAGVAALWWEALRSKNPVVTRQMVWNEILKAARTDCFGEDVGPFDRGAGLIQAPEN